MISELRDMVNFSWFLLLVVFAPSLHIFNPHKKTPCLFSYLTLRRHYKKERKCHVEHESWGERQEMKRHCLFRLALQWDSCIGLWKEWALAGSTFGNQIWYYVGGMASQERKQRRRFPLILPILLTTCFPFQDLLDFPTTRTESARRVGSQQPNSTGCHSCWPAPSTPSIGLPSAASPKAVTKIISRATDPSYIWLPSLPFLPPGPEPLLFYRCKYNTQEWHGINGVPGPDSFLILKNESPVSRFQSPWQNIMEMGCRKNLSGSQQSVTHRQYSTPQLRRTEHHNNKQNPIIGVIPSRLLHSKELSMFKSPSMGYKVLGEENQRKCLPTSQCDGTSARLLPRWWLKLHTDDSEKTKWEGRQNGLKAAD